MEHMVLTAHDLGLGTCWVGAYDEDGIKEALGIPGKYKVIAIMPLGYPKDKETMIEKTTKAMIGSKKRKPMEEIVCFDNWKF
jgi:nitroreductase